MRILSVLRTLVLFAIAIPLLGQSWDNLKALKPGDQVQVIDTSGQQQRAAFAAVSATAITLETRTGQVSIDKARVHGVKARSSAVRTRNIVIGAAIGIAIGATIDQTLGVRLRNESGESEGARAITYIAPAGVMGALRAFPAYRAVYRAP